MARLVIVERYDEIRELLSALFQARGHEVDAADDSEAALERLRAKSFDCAVIGSPITIDREGETMRLLEYIGEHHPEWCASIVVLTTQVQDASLMSLAERLGVCAVFAKPFDVHELESVVAHCASGRKPARRWFGVPHAVLEAARPPDQ